MAPTTDQDLFFERPILNSPYDYPGRHWELDEEGQPTHNIIDRRRLADFISAVPKAKRRRRSATEQAQLDLVVDEGHGLSSQDQLYRATDVINQLRKAVDQWRDIPNPNDWRVTPETVRLLQHWRHHVFSG